VLVGGSAAAAVIACLRGSRGGPLSILAGAVMVGWIVGEILILTGDGELVSATEVVFAALGVAMLGLGFAARQTARGLPSRS
jgi:hypothetical protein